MSARIVLATLAVSIASGPLPRPDRDYPPPFPRAGVVQAFENDRVIVWKGLAGIKSRPTAMHQHKLAMAAVFLDDGGRTRTIAVDGGVRESTAPSRRGGVTFQAAGIIHSEDALVDGIRAVAIELKIVSARQQTADSGLPAQSARGGATLRLENERVAMFEYQWPSGHPERLHVVSRDAVLVPFESGAIRIAASAGQVRTVELTFGEPMWIARGTSMSEGAVQGSPRAILVELK